MSDIMPGPSFDLQAVPLENVLPPFVSDDAEQRKLVSLAVQITLERLYYSDAAAIKTDLLDNRNVMDDVLAAYQRQK